jgi:hypothetical protein
MEYKYSPIFKYIILLICIFMFTKHLKIVTNHQNLIITISIIIMIIIFDYVLIDNHPNLLDMDSDNDKNLDNDKEDFIGSTITDNSILDKDIEEILSNMDTNDIIDDLENDESEVEYPNRKEKAFYQLPTDYRKPSYDLDIDCYKRGDGRGNNLDTERYYTKDVF